MKKKVLSLTIVMCMALSMAACGKTEELEKEVTAIMEEVVELAKEETSVEETVEEVVEEVHEETTDEETVDEVVEDTDIEENKEEIIEDAGSEEKETSENLSNENVIEETTKNLSEEKVVEVPVETPITTPVETPVEEVVEVPVETPITTPVETPIEDNKKETSTDVPVLIPDNSDIYYGPAEYSDKTITTDTGFVVPLLKEFNQIGANLDNDNYSWTGKWGDPMAEASLDKMLDTCDAFGIHHDSATGDFLLANQNELHWYPWDQDGNPHLELRKGGDHWKLIIATPILDLKTAQANGNWPGINEWDVKYAKDALVVLLSTITPDAKELQFTILNSLYIGNESLSMINMDGSWLNVGKSKIMLDEWNFKNGNHIIVFRIASK